LSNGFESKLGPPSATTEYPTEIKTIVSGFVTAKDGTQLSIRLSFTTEIHRGAGVLWASSRIEQIDEYSPDSKPTFSIFPISTIDQKQSFDTNDKKVAIAWDAIKNSFPDMPLERLVQDKLHPSTV
jgi:hypothetical protein